MPGSANHVSLVEAQRNYAIHGSSERRNRGQTRSPLNNEPRDERWRPVDIGRDNVEVPQRGRKYAESYPYEDTTVLYYWRPTYWRRVVG
jgi:hypothetical protein